jgi:hypothetical protein
MMPAAAARGIAACSPVKAKVGDVVVVSPLTTGAVVVVTHGTPEALPALPPEPEQSTWALAAEAPTTVRQTRNPRHRVTLIASRPIVRT